MDQDETHERLVAALRRYLVRRPFAGDDAQGIRDFWLADFRLPVGEEALMAALLQLEREGLLLRSGPPERPRWSGKGLSDGSAS